MNLSNDIEWQLSWPIQRRHASDSLDRLRASIDNEGTSFHASTSFPSCKKVSFSQHSQIRVYPIDKEIDRQKSYSRLERKMFQAQARLDALRIQSLMQMFPYEGDVAIRHLMDLNLLANEDLLGIENLVSGEKMSGERRKHSRLAIKAQCELQETNNANVSGDVHAKVSFKRGLSNIEKACSQAAMAA